MRAHSRSVRSSWVTLWGGEGLRVSLTQGDAVLADSSARGTHVVPWDPPTTLRTDARTGSELHLKGK